MDADPSVNHSALSDQIRRELENLTDTQRCAATWRGSAVILAGPGSGKTRTIAARIGYLLQTQPSPFRGLASITYTNDAARELRRRLKNLGVNTGQFFTASTVHSFCLNEIVRPLSSLVGWKSPSAGAVMDADESLRVWDEVFTALGISGNAQWEVPTLTRIRRRIASGEDCREFDQRHVAAANLFDAKLVDRGKIDFEAMVSRALILVRSSVRVRASLVARFPHIVIDEYQDLGSVLHSLILELQEAGATVTAVGDADQTILGFTGSDPRYIAELSELEYVRSFSLDTNFRSPGEIVAASARALEVDRSYRSAEAVVRGEVELRVAPGDYGTHGRIVVEEVLRALNDGFNPDQIAILYPRRGSLITSVRGALDLAEVNYSFESESKLPNGPLSRFVQMCATRVMAGKSALGGEAYSGVPLLADLTLELEGLYRNSQLSIPDRIILQRSIYMVTDGHRVLGQDELAQDWLDEVSTTLDLALIAGRSLRAEDDVALRLFESRSAAWTAKELTSAFVNDDRIRVTNYFKAKGREFDVVIMPGLVEREVPLWRFHNYRRVAPNAEQLAAQRREFYVAMTRTRRRNVLIAGNTYVDKHGRPSPADYSRFARKVFPELP